MPPCSSGAPAWGQCAANAWIEAPSRTMTRSAPPDVTLVMVPSRNSERRPIFCMVRAPESGTECGRLQAGSRAVRHALSGPLCKLARIGTLWDRRHSGSRNRFVARAGAEDTQAVAETQKLTTRYSARDFEHPAAAANEGTAEPIGFNCPPLQQFDTTGLYCDPHFKPDSHLATERLRTTERAA
jgi:hypothetical protein